jgi:hypothetical protein
MEEFQLRAADDEEERDHCFEVLREGADKLTISCHVAAERTSWMNAMELQPTVNVGSAAVVPDCPAGARWVLCSFIVTSDQIYVTRESFSGDGFRLVTSRPLESASAIAADSDGVCVIDFDSESDDLEPWHVLFKTKHSLATFASVVNDKWKELYQVDLLVTGIQLFDTMAASSAEE